MRRRDGLLTMLLAAALPLAGASAQAPTAATALRPDQVRFRALYQELVETNTTRSAGSCTDAAARMGAHLAAAGFGAGQITYFSVPEHPREGGLVAILPGRDAKARPILLLGHLDVVEAKAADWTRDPFRMVEEDGYFRARGVADMKALDAIWVDTLVRIREAGNAPRRTIKLALTCGEESTGAFNGAEWLAKNRPDLIAAAFALNEGGGGTTDGQGKLVVQKLQVGEKAVQNYRIEARNAGGHSSIPIRDNAIYELADALVKIRDHEFPAEFTETTRAFFAKAGAVRGDALGAAMVAIARDPHDAAAAAIVNQDRTLHSTLRTTCVATLLDGGHANNALPQRAGANVNCRIFPGHSVQAVQAELTRIIADPKLTVTLDPPIRPLAVPPPLDPKVVEPAERLAATYFPGVPVVPAMLVGATDGIFLEAIGIPVYGVPGPWSDPDGNGVHGLNERIAVKAVYTGRDYLHDLVRAYADAD